VQNEKLKIKNINLKNGAVIIADVHYKKGDKEFLSLLKNLNQNPPVQLFLLGDIFHLLLPFEYLKNYNKEAIELINSLAKKTEVFYTYGNHDFWLEGIFQNVVFADGFVDKKKSIFLTHGDLTEKDSFYQIYIKIIRNKMLVKILNILSLNFINNWLFKKILRKNIKCNKISNFKTIIFNKIADISYNIIIEGHYHQNIIFDFNNKKYFALGAYFCKKCYYTYKDYRLKEIDG